MEIDLTHSDDDEVQWLGVKPAPPSADGKPAAKRRRRTTRDTDEVQFLGVQASQPATWKHPTSNKRRTFSCNICMEDDLPGNDGFTLFCRHRFCKTCLSGLIASVVNDKASNDVAIECPAPDCNTKLSTSEVQYILRHDPPAFATFASKADVARLEREASTHANNTRRCPAERCNFIFVFEPGTGAEGTSFDCPACQERFCLHCGANRRRVGPSNTGMSCHERSRQLQQRAEEREKFRRWQSENAQADRRFHDLLQKEQRAGKTLSCPSCKMPITKNGGCHHMRCTSCNKSFHWKGK